MRESKLSEDQKEDLKSVFTVQGKSKDIFNVVFETLDENEAPVTITQSEFMRRMKDMSAIGGGMNFYGELPDSYNLVINPNHSLIIKINDDLKSADGDKLSANDTERKRVKEEIAFMEGDQKKKKADEVSQVEKDDLEKLKKELGDLENARKEVLEVYGSENKIVKQLIDIAMLANNMLKGEELSTFVKRSVELL
jgi:molecular chaperone HtpG